MFKIPNILFEIPNILFQNPNILFEISNILFKIFNILFEIPNILFKIPNILFGITNVREIKSIRYPWQYVFNYKNKFFFRIAFCGLILQNKYLGFSNRIICLESKILRQKLILLRVTLFDTFLIKIFKSKYLYYHSLWVLHFKIVTKSL